MQRLVFILMVLLLAVPCLGDADGDANKKRAKRDSTKAESSKDSKASARNKKTVRPVVAITKQQEAAAKAFVKEHHDDLFELLIHLKEGSPNDYARAIRDLSRASERLAGIEKRDVERYKLELKLWKAQSRRQLITAKLQMGVDDSLLKELRDTLRQEQELSIAILKHERGRLSARLDKLDDQLTTQEAGMEENVEKRFAALTRSAKNSQRSVSTKGRKAPAKKKTKDPT